MREWERVVRDGNHFIRMWDAGLVGEEGHWYWALIDGPWFEYLEGAAERNGTGNWVLVSVPQPGDLEKPEVRTSHWVKREYRFGLQGRGYYWRWWYSDPEEWGRLPSSLSGEPVEWTLMRMEKGG